MTRTEETEKLLDDAEDVLFEGRAFVEEVMEFIADRAVARQLLLKKKSLEVILEAITEEVAQEGDVKWARRVARENTSDATFYPAPGLCEDLAERVKGVFRQKSGDDFAASLFNGLKPPTREQMESWRVPPTNPASTGRVAVRSGDGVQFIDFGE